MNGQKGLPQKPNQVLYEIKHVIIILSSDNYMSI